MPQDDPATLTAELRQQIAAAIDAAGFSQRDLKVATGIAQSSISRALTGAADPSLSTVVRLLSAAGCRLRVERVGDGP
jgi:DNA-binding phage protein